VRRLKILEAIDLAIAVEMAGGIGIGLEALEKVAKRLVDAGRKLLSMIPDAVAALIVEPGKTQALQQAACLALPCLF